jgi:regulator of replication initiation timing
VPPAGLEPDTLNSKFTELEETDERRAAELKETEQKLIDAFDVKSAAIVQAIRAQVDDLTGELRDQLTQVPGLSAEAQALEGPNRELVNLGLNTRTKYTIFSLQSEVEQLAAHLQHLIEQNKGAQFEVDNRARIAAYNAKALPFVQEAEVAAVSGDLVERRMAFLQKQEELAVKNEGAQVLVSDF